MVSSSLALLNYRRFSVRPSVHPLFGGPQTWSEGLPARSEVLLAWFEGLPAWSEGLIACTEGLPASYEGLPAWSEGLPARYEGLPARQRGTDVQMYGQTENILILQDFVHNRGCCPKTWSTINPTCSLIPTLTLILPTHSPRFTVINRLQDHPSLSQKSLFSYMTNMLPPHKGVRLHSTQFVLSHILKTV